MVDPLSNAQQLMNMVLETTVKAVDTPSEFAVEMAKAYAAIAQAEQLKRIADRLDSICATEDGLSVVRTASVRW